MFFFYHFIHQTWRRRKWAKPWEIPEGPLWQSSPIQVQMTNSWQTNVSDVAVLVKSWDAFHCSTRLSDRRCALPASFELTNRCGRIQATRRQRLQGGGRRRITRSLINTRGGFHLHRGVRLHMVLDSLVCKDSFTHRRVVVYFITTSRWETNLVIDWLISSESLINKSSLTPRVELNYHTLHFPASPFFSL